MPLASGDVFAGYTVVRQIGTGGMGAVYLVRHPRLPRLDALKLLRPELSANPDFTRRFLREADVVAGLSHHNIVTVHDRGEHDGQLWLSMRYVEGVDAEQILSDSGNLLPAERVAHIVKEVAAALDAAHRQHVIHRDVKPANILLAPSADDEPEQVFLTDFGIAKSLEEVNPGLTGTGEILASFDYASPEQIRSERLGARSDVYSLAGVLHKLLTGSVPFPGAYIAAAIQGHLMRPPPRPTALVPWLAPRIDDVVARGMAKDPAERFATCRELATAAAAALRDFPAPPAPPYTVTLTQPRSRSVVGPLTTDRMAEPDTDRLVDLVRRTRFFDLPEDLHELAGRTNTGGLPGGGRPVTLEIRAGRAVRRVTADLMEARRPQALDSLVAALEQFPSAPVGTAGQTVVYDAPDVRSGTDVAPSLPFRADAGAIPPPADGRLGDTRRRRRPARVRILLAAAIVGVCVLAAAAGDVGTTPVAAYRSLPRAAALPDTVLVVPRGTSDESSHLYLVDSATGETIGQLTDSPVRDVAPLISPDRRTILFLRRRADDTRQLMTTSTAGTGERPALAAASCPDVKRPAWNPANPAQLALPCVRGADTSLLVMSLNGTVVRELDPGVPTFGDPSFSPDGTRLAFWGTSMRVEDGPEVTGGALYVMEVDGSAEPVRLTDVGPGVDSGPAWSPDGTLIAFSRQISDGTRRIMLVDAEGRFPERQLTAGPGLDQRPAWSPDGEAVAFVNRPDGRSPQHVWIIDRDGGPPRQLRDDDVTAAPAWGSR